MPRCYKSGKPTGGEPPGRQRVYAQVQPFDGTALDRSDATFCPKPGKDGKGNTFYALKYPMKYIRHYNGSVYIASDGNSTNPWDTTALWSDDTSFIVSAPWLP